MASTRKKLTEVGKRNEESNRTRLILFFELLIGVILVGLVILLIGLFI
jgi:hypothetical protein